MISTKDLDNTGGKPSKREKILELKKKHTEIFKKEKVDYPKFIPRMAYKHDGELIVGFYPSEAKGGTDIYTEFVSRDYEPEDPERRLWKWIYNSNYADEYKCSEPHPTTGDKRFLVPIEELINVTELYEKQIQNKIEDFEDVPDQNSDLPIDGLTIRDFASIIWSEPVSHKAWLNKLIESIKKQKNK
tara:strand:+ start:2954 stop:3514 length:561 start_codon:yes stop_codon:yes gene_type:complete